MVFLICFYNHNADSQCLSPQAIEPDPVEGIECGTTSPGSVTVRVYLHIIKNTDCSGGLTAGIQTALKEFLTNVYSAHNINLNFPTCNLDLCDNVVARENLQQYLNSNSIPDGINGYLFNDAGGGDAYFIPSTNFYAGGLDFKTVAHELGHCLGLHHTFNCQGGNNECVDRNHTSATNGGDKVCDTDADPNNGIDENTCLKTTSLFDNNRSEHNGCLSPFTNTCAGDEYNPPVQNIMSYYGECRESFTPGQAERMKQMMMLSPILQYAASDGNEVISSNTTWTSDVTMDYNLLVKSGITLTIKAKLKMATSRKIILEGGATLIVDGGTLTIGNSKKICGGTQDTGPFWKGVEIGKNGGRGTVQLINNAIIEHSYSGLYNSTGGRAFVVANNAFWYNNRSGIDMISSNRTNVMLFISNSVFELNAQYKGSDYYHQIILANGIANFNYCRIENKTNIFPNFIAAILEDGTALQFRNSSKVSGYYYGVKASGNMNTFNIDNNIFEKFFYGVWTMGVSNFRLVNNEFKAGAYGTNFTSTGLFIWSGTGFQISNNDFINFSVLPRRSNGIEVNHVNDFEDNYISSDNTFTGLYYGIELSRFRSPTLLITCNDFNNCREDIYIRPSSQVKRIQNFNMQPAGNTFTSPPLDFNYHNLHSTDIDYWYNGLIASHYPQSVNKVNRIRRDRSGDRCYQEPICPECDPESLHDQRFNNLLTTESNVQDSLDNLLDGGHSAYWIAEVQQASIHNAGALLTQLQSLSPNISSELLTEVWIRDDLFTGQERFEMVCVNPLVMVEETFYKLVQDTSNGITIQMKDSLQNLEIPSSGLRYELVKRSSEIRHEKISLCHAMSSFHQFNDTSGIANAIKWLDRIPVVSARMDAALLSINNGDFNVIPGYLSQINSLATANGSAQLQAEAEAFESLIDILLPAYEDNRFIGNLDSNEVGQLQNLAIQGNYFANVLASGWLEFYYGISAYYEPLRVANDSGFKYFSSASIPDAISELQLPSAEVYPTLVQDELVLYTSGIDKRSLLELTIVNIFGIVRKKMTISESSNIIKIDATGLSKGAYFINLVLDHKPLSTARIIKI
jgi:hypothetical protein